MVYSIFTKHIVAHSFWIWHFFLESIKTFRKCYNGRQNGCSNDQVKKRTCAMKSLNLWDIKATLFCCMCVCVYTWVCYVCVCVWFSCHCRCSIAEKFYSFYGNNSFLLKDDYALFIGLMGKKKPPTMFVDSTHIRIVNWKFSIPFCILHQYSWWKKLRSKQVFIYKMSMLLSFSQSNFVSVGFST